MPLPCPASPMATALPAALRQRSRSLKAAEHTILTHSLVRLLGQYQSECANPIAGRPYCFDSI
jgi:hypothetical protein